MHKGFFFNNEKNNYIKEYLEEKLLEYGKMNYAYLVINKRNLDEIMVISDLNDYFKNTYLRKNLKM